MTVADAETSDVIELGGIYTGVIDTTPPSGFEWKSVCETRLTVTSTTETNVYVQSKPFVDIDSFRDIDSHAAEVIYVWMLVYIARLSHLFCTLQPWETKP